MLRFVHSEHPQPRSLGFSFHLEKVRFKREKRWVAGNEVAPL